MAPGLADAVGVRVLILGEHASLAGGHLEDTVFAEAGEEAAIGTGEGALADELDGGSIDSVAHADDALPALAVVVPGLAAGVVRREDEHLSKARGAGAVVIDAQNLRHLSGRLGHGEQVAGGAVGRVLADDALCAGVDLVDEVAVFGQGVGVQAR